ncbi:hypothetical protein MBRA1_001670 [Malassezia brasiliensis]|uniref:Inhibitor I9 domain-containing protein n=1 Tax=Malassezia brasiliensis TaxID=1821822 RepID=A0AAF0DRV8_9BASI|nr:hypothetical protein MBRA1_001670 [Malassezia brasiliensis]
MQSYVVMFRKSASDKDVDKYVNEVQEQGGTIQQRYNADFLRGFAARMPPKYVEKLEQNKKHDGLIESIEPNQEIHIN